MPSPKPASKSSPLALLAEGERVMRICNACRYCEGFCAVFPALERRLNFSEKDLNFLANLCHDCGECYYSCQYAPPHEFAVNLPQTLAAIRRESYSKYAWPGWFAGLLRWNTLALILSTVAAPVLFFLLLRMYVPASVLFAAHSVAEGSFYQVVPHGVMMTAFGTTETAIEAMQLGAYEYLLKPFDVPALLKTVEHALATRRLTHPGRAARCR